MATFTGNWGVGFEVLQYFMAFLTDDSTLNLPFDINRLLVYYFLQFLGKFLNQVLHP